MWGTKLLLVGISQLYSQIVFSPVFLSFSSPNLVQTLQWDIPFRPNYWWMHNFLCYSSGRLFTCRPFENDPQARRHICSAECFFRRPYLSHESQQPWQNIICSNLSSVCGCTFRTLQEWRCKWPCLFLRWWEHLRILMRSFCVAL